MNLQDALAIVERLPRPHLTADRGAELYHHVIATRPIRVLELGSGRGGSALYMAAALDELKAGQILSVDSSRWPWRNPTARELLEAAGLGHLVHFTRPYATYNWYLKQLLLENLAQPPGQHLYDLVFIDGAKDFSTVAASFVMVTKLLRRGGWLVCDDLGWTYRDNCTSSRHFGLALDELTDEERAMPQVGAAFELFVANSSEFAVCTTTSNWMGWAQRR